MYPNIILTNRLQPGAIVDEATCAACDFNSAENKCKRQMDWVWRGDFNPASKNEYERASSQLQYEVVDGRPFHEHEPLEQAEIVKNRLKQYSHKVYKKTKITQEETRTDTVCMRENPFYVETVRNFRDRRYDYKLLTKDWKAKKKAAEKVNDKAAMKTADDMSLVYDSLQVSRVESSRATSHYETNIIYLARHNAGRPQVHSEQFLRLRDEEGGSVEEHGDGGHRDADGRPAHHPGPRARRANWPPFGGELHTCLFIF